VTVPTVHDGVEGGRADPGRSVLGRALAVLDTFSNERPEQTLGTIAHLAVRDGDRVLYLERLMARPEVHVRSRVARRLPLHATGPGKVLLAHAPDDVLVSRGLQPRRRPT
jgi:DNA-binding IclR family transcriptional regulator